MALEIGPHRVDVPLMLAPMAGASDYPFRRLCRELGAGLCTSEMLISDQRFWSSSKSSSRLPIAGEQSPRSIQIAGTDPAQLADAARACADLGAEIIDINMGCPAKKVCNRAAGSALLRDEALVGRILEAVVGAVTVPVTLKTRTGWSPEQRNGKSIAHIAEQSGIALLTLHGRTRACRFGGSAEYDTIADVVRSVSIPVIANGDIDGVDKARFVLEKTGAAGLMIGRAALGRPWLFGAVAASLYGRPWTAPDWHERRQIMLRHVRYMHEYYDEALAVRLTRKHVDWYLAGSDPQRTRRRQFPSLDSTREQRAWLNEWQNADHPLDQLAA